MPTDTPQGLGSILSSRSRAVRAAHSPLGFCVLALLIVETFLWGSGAVFGLSMTWKLICMGIGVGLFLLVFGAVIWLVVRYPQNLVFSEESHVQFAALKMYGSERQALSGVDLAALSASGPPTPTSGQLIDGSSKK